jgi:hypothetical protein
MVTSWAFWMYLSGSPDGHNLRTSRRYETSSTERFTSSLKDIAMTYTGSVISTVTIDVPKSACDHFVFTRCQKHHTYIHNRIDGIPYMARLIEQNPIYSSDITVPMIETRTDLIEHDKIVYIRYKHRCHQIQ